MKGKTIIAAAVALFLLGLFHADATKPIKPVRQSAEAPLGDIRAIYMELGYNMWCDYPSEAMMKGRTPEEAAALLPKGKQPDFKLRCRDEYFRQVADYAAEKGVNMIVVDLGEGVLYPSHPELAIEGTWSVRKMQDEIRRLNSMGIEVIPKMNFSTTHNGWMKDYRHMVSSGPYYRFCEDVIRDAYEIFGHPRFIHIGYDEESEYHQKQMGYQNRRVNEVWWADFLHLVGFVHELGARPMVWADYGWENPEYFERCPKYCVMQNWFYDECYGGFDLEANKTADHDRLGEYLKLEEAGFDQIPCGTNWVGGQRDIQNVGADDVIGKLVEFGRKNISREHLYGFMMAPWEDCSNEENVAKQLKAIDLFEEALKQ